MQKSNSLSEKFVQNDLNISPLVRTKAKFDKFLLTDSSLIELRGGDQT